MPEARPTESLSQPNCEWRRGGGGEGSDRDRNQKYVFSDYILYEERGELQQQAAQERKQAKWGPNIMMPSRRRLHPINEENDVVIQ